MAYDETGRWIRGGSQPCSAEEFMMGARPTKLALVREMPARCIKRKDGRRMIRMGLFRCECGGEKHAELRNVKRGLTRSCGCIRQSAT